MNDFEISNLNLYYGDNHVLKNINMNIENRSITAFIGPSGCGKSTLLRCLDRMNDLIPNCKIEGNIKYEDTDINSINPIELRTKVGMVFQNPNPFPMSIFDNIAYGPRCQGIHNKKKLINIVVDSLKKAALYDEVKDRLKDNALGLSGGQQQRLCIARCIAMNPKVILMDEPTGNLDAQTTKDILTILKQESKTKLVLIVSHNLEDAEKYGDRIIELQDGKILSDVTKQNNYENKFIIENDIIKLPHHTDLTTKEIDNINKLTQNKNGQIVQIDNGFIDTKEVDQSINNFKLESNHISFKNYHSLSMMFNRKGRSFTAFTILITTLLISLMFLLQSFLLFNPIDGLAKDEIVSVAKVNKQPRKNSYRTSFKYDISEEDINKFYENGYNGKIYKIYNYTLFTDCLKPDNDYELIFEQSQIIKYNSINMSRGVKEVDKDYLIKHFSQDGKDLKIIYGSLEGNGLIITDYLFDALVYNVSSNPITEELLNKKESLLKRKNITAIIDTGYKEKYCNLLNEGNLAKKNHVDKQKYFDEMFATDLGNEFINDVLDRLAYCYILNKDIYDNVIDKQNYVEYISNVYIESPFTDKLNYIRLQNLEAYNYTDNDGRFSLKDNEVVLSMFIYGKFFNAYYNGDLEHEFKPFEFKLKRYNMDNTKLIDEVTLKCVGIYDSTYFSSNAIKEVNRFNYNVQEIEFDDPSQDNAIRSTCKQLGLCPYCYDSYAYPLINSIIIGFGGFIKLIAIILFVFSIMYIIGYGINNIKQNLYEIGVLKSLGCKNFDISIIFFIKTLFTGLLISILSILGIILFTKVGNNILVNSFENFATAKFNNVNIIYNNVNLATLDVVLTLIIILISSFIPLFYLSKIKPIVILRNNKNNNKFSR